MLVTRISTASSPAADIDVAVERRPVDRERRAAPAPDAERDLAVDGAPQVEALHLAERRGARLQDLDRVGELRRRRRSTPRRRSATAASIVASDRRGRTFGDGEVHRDLGRRRRCVDASPPACPSGLPGQTGRRHACVDLALRARASASGRRPAARDAGSRTFGRRA